MLIEQTQQQQEEKKNNKSLSLQIFNAYWMRMESMAANQRVKH